MLAEHLLLLEHRLLLEDLLVEQLVSELLFLQVLLPDLKVKLAVLQAFLRGGEGTWIFLTQSQAMRMSGSFLLDSWSALQQSLLLADFFELEFWNGDLALPCVRRLELSEEWSGHLVISRSRCSLVDPRYLADVGRQEARVGDAVRDVRVHNVRSILVPLDRRDEAPLLVWWISWSTRIRGLLCVDNVVEIEAHLPALLFEHLALAALLPLAGELAWRSDQVAEVGLIIWIEGDSLGMVR